MSEDIYEKATLAGGCFWCTEAVFKRLKGVVKTEPGYTGGTVENPTYEKVCSGNTGHAEAVQITFDPSVISYEKVLYVFFKLHNPTELNRQGNDVGTQYRSAVFYHSQEQKKTAEEMIGQLEKNGVYQNIVTEVTPYTSFYNAEKYHEDYYENNKYQPYCTFVIDPKIKKLYKDFKDDLKEEYQKSA